MSLKPQVRELVLKERRLIFKIQKVKAAFQVCSCESVYLHHVFYKSNY